MKKNFLLLAAIGMCVNLYAENLKPIAQKINNQRAALDGLAATSLFNVSTANGPQITQLNTVVSNATLLDFKQANTTAILSSKPANLHFNIPTKTGANIELELFKSDFITPDFSVVTSSSNGEPVAYTGGVHYWGIIKGDNSSLAAISIFNDEVAGMISSPTIGNLVLGKVDNNAQGLHILYNDKDLHATKVPQCFTPEDGGGYGKDLDYSGQGNQTMSVNCIRLYWEVNYDIFQGKGSVTAATNYVTSVFNQSAILYSNDGIPVSLSQVFVWDVASPYTGTSTSTLLSQFQSTRNSFNGDLGHLLGYVGNGGIAASISGICNSNTDYKQCYSDINSTYSNVPTYSWTVEVVTHEQGHLMGSRHTHACAWNGNNTAIDNCGPTAGYAYEGSCSGAPTPVNGGTIMSYCHLVGNVGINFSNGFGPQPKAAILAKYNAATCLTACTGGATCNAPTGMSTGSIGQTSAVFSWTAATGATSYNVQYRKTGTTTWSAGSTTTTSFSVTGLTAATSYEWQVQTVCSSGSSAFTSSTTFTTSSSVTCGVPAGLGSSSITNSGATCSWGAVAGATSYTLQWKLTSGQTWNTITGITTTSRALTGLSSCTAYQFHVLTVCSSGSSAYSTTASFTTTGCTTTYCTSAGTNQSYEYINKVVLGAINNTSGSNGGYGNYTSLTTNLAGGSANTITLTPGFTGSAYREYWKVYIDYNKNGVFTDAGENVATVNSTSAVSATFTVPATALNGTTRMRVQMRYNSSATSSCGNYTYGEVEDYSVNITGNAQSPQGDVSDGSSSIEPPSKMKELVLYPNPATDNITVEFEAAQNGVMNYVVYNLVGEKIIMNQQNIREGLNVISVNTSALSKGVYIFEEENNGTVQRHEFMISR